MASDLLIEARCHAALGSDEEAAAAYIRAAVSLRAAGDALGVLVVARALKRECGSVMSSKDGVLRVCKEAGLSVEEVLEVLGSVEEVLEELGIRGPESSADASAVNATPASGEAAMDLGLTAEEGRLLQEDLRKGDREASLERIAAAQERQRTAIKETTGVDVLDTTPVIGRDISWADIVDHAFRVSEFDRAGTVVDQDDHVKAENPLKPYGYLLVESPILNQETLLPITHGFDFLLAASVFDEPRLADAIAAEEMELLVTYSPKHLLPGGLSGSPHHVLHYVIVPRGALDSYYSENEDAHMAKPDPQELFGPFVYEGAIAVRVNRELRS